LFLCGITDTLKTITYETSMKVASWFILSCREEKGSNIVAVFLSSFFVLGVVNVGKCYSNVHPHPLKSTIQK
jgi:CO dehydrogenase/acetyl-CoA synthase alpha subunit